MNRIRATLLAAAAVWATAWLAPAQAAEPVTIKLATIAPQDSPYYDVLREMGEAWQAASGGQIVLRIYASGVAGDEIDVVRKMRVGQLQASAMSGGGLPDIVPELRALQMPMMFRSEAERDYVAERIRPQLEALFAARGFKVLGWAPTGWVYFYTQTPVVTPEDLRPLAIFAWAGNSGFVDAWKAAGFRPVALPATEIMTGLQSGLINAVAVPPLAALASQWFGLAPHMTDLKWASLEGALVISASAWDGMPDDLKPILEQAARDACARLSMKMYDLSARAVEVMKQHGLVVHAVSAEQEQAWEAVARSAYPSIIGKLVPAALVADVERLRDEYRASHSAE